jgi:hypothetical protein
MVDSINMIFTTLCRVQQEIQKYDETNVQLQSSRPSFGFEFTKLLITNQGISCGQC